jgi:hypothetical protein
MSTGSGPFQLDQLATATSSNTYYNSIAQYQYASVWTGTAACNILAVPGWNLGSATAWTYAFQAPATNACSGITGVETFDLSSWGTTKAAGLTSATLSTTTNCAVSSASPGACGSAAAGAFGVPATVATYVINTSAVTANSEIFLQFDESLGTRLGVTCGTTVPTTGPAVTARTAGTSFTVALTASATNYACYNYRIVN